MLAGDHSALTSAVLAARNKLIEGRSAQLDLPVGNSSSRGSGGGGGGGGGSDGQHRAHRHGEDDDDDPYNPNRRERDELSRRYQRSHCFRSPQ